MNQRRLRVFAAVQSTNVVGRVHWRRTALLTFHDLSKERALASPKMRIPCDRRELSSPELYDRWSWRNCAQVNVLNYASPKDAPRKGGASSTQLKPLGRSPSGPHKAEHQSSQGAPSENYRDAKHE
jgi:hypothetical protein